MILQKYTRLIQDFLDERISVEEFEKIYLSEFKAEKIMIESSLFRILDRLFASVDCYWSGCAEGQESAFEISEVQLRKDAMNALKALADLGL